MARLGGHLGRYGVFAAMLSAAGLPLYIHAPKVYADTYGVSLATMGAILFGLRLLDVVQDPLLGRLAGALRNRRAMSVSLAVLVMAFGMIGLFAIAPPVPAALWFAVMLTLVFSAFSFLTICFYAQGVTRAEAMPGAGHLTVARYRETGALLGICIAAIFPIAATEAGFPGYVGYALFFAGLSLLAGGLMHGEWQGDPPPPAPGFAVVLRDRTARRLLVVALLNAAPVAVSSTLFLFFVESRLAAPGWDGPLLLLFFVAAAASAPVWGALAARVGEKPILLLAMGLAVISFGFALTLQEGDVGPFALICLASGAALGADLTVLPALFARRMARIAPNATEGFALWSFVSKLSLAFAAVALLPALDAVGFRSGGDNTQEALRRLTLLYALVPCALKLVAIAVLAATDLEDDTCLVP